MEKQKIPITAEACQASATDMKKVAFASAIGTTIEYYDFTLYATATALVFNHIFFPTGDPLIGTLAAFATFFVGYCARPIGGVLFGHIGDRLGRKKALMATILIMGIGTFIMGLVPSYETIGIWAPIFLVILRILQGIGIGGEYGGGMVMTVEHAPRKQRGFYSALVHIGVPAGFLLPIIFLNLLSYNLDRQAFLDWGWRIPFLLSIVLVALGVFIRFQISETPAFRRVMAKSETASMPVVDALTGQYRNILFGIGAKIAESGLFNIYAVFAVSYCALSLKIPKEIILNGVLLACLIECFTLPFFGKLSDIYGRRTVYVSGMIFQFILAFFFFLLLDSGSIILIWLAIALGLALGHGLGHGSVFGAQGAFFAELFPAKIRYSGLSLVQQFGPLLGGGLSPFLATFLMLKVGIWAVVVYMAAMAILSAVCSFGLRKNTTD